MPPPTRRRGPAPTPSSPTRTPRAPGRPMRSWGACSTSPSRGAVCLVNVPEAGHGVLGDVAGLDVVELGCGTAYFSSWLARRGARPIGVDLTPAQLATAGALEPEVGGAFPLLAGGGG